MIYTGRKAKGDENKRKVIFKGNKKHNRRPAGTMFLVFGRRCRSLPEEEPIISFAS